MVQIIRGKKPKKILERIEKFKGTQKTDSAKKAYKNFKLLLTQKGLFLDIQKFRKKWNMKINLDDKIIDKTESDIKKWEEQVEEPIDFSSAESMDQSPLVKSLIARMEWERKHPPTNKEIKENENRFKDIIKIMKKYNVPSIYFDLFRSLIYTNTISLHSFETSNQTGAHFFTSRDADGDPCMAIRIYPETTTKDMIAEWPNIELYRDKFLGFNISKQSERKHIDRDLRVMQLKYSGQSSKDIADTIKEEFPNKTPFTYDDVNKIIYEINQLHSDKSFILP